MPPYGTSSGTTWIAAPMAMSGETLTSPVQHRRNPNHALFNERDRAIVDAVIEGEIQGINATKRDKRDKQTPESSPHGYGPRMINCNPAGACLGSQLRPEGTLGNGARIFGKFTMEVNTWSLGWVSRTRP